MRCRSSLRVGGRTSLKFAESPTKGCAASAPHSSSSAKRKSSSPKRAHETPALSSTGTGFVGTEEESRPAEFPSIRSATTLIITPIFLEPSNARTRHRHIRRLSESPSARGAACYDPMNSLFSGGRSLAGMCTSMRAGPLLRSLTCPSASSSSCMVETSRPQPPPKACGSWA